MKKKNAKIIFTAAVLLVLLAATAFILSRLNKQMPEIEAKLAAEQEAK